MISFLLKHIYLASVISVFPMMRALESLITVSSQRKKRCLLYASCWLLNITPIIISDMINLPIAMGSFFVSVLFACEGSIWKKTTISSLYASTFFSFNALRENYIKPYFFPHLYPYDSNASGTIALPQAQFFTVIVSFLFALLFGTGIKRFALEKDYTLPDSLWKLILLLTATPFGTILCIILLYDAGPPIPIDRLEHQRLYLFIFLITLLSFISLLWCIRVLARQQALERQNSLMETNRKYYEAMEQQHFEIRRLKHDLANHIQALSVLPGDKQAGYIQNLEGIMTKLQPLSYCGDATVNAVLSVKKAAMERYGIRSRISIDIPSELPFRKPDICALYANAIDNAIEACRMMDCDDCIIDIQGRIQKGLFCLSVRNPVVCAEPVCSGRYRFKRLPDTSKEDKGRHGFGLKSMREIVARYQGEMELEMVDGMFEVFLYLPLEAVG